MYLQKSAIILLFIIALIGIVTIGVSFFNQIACEGQLINNNVAPSFEQQILGEHIIGQSFIAPYSGLHRIDILFQTYGRKNTPDVTLRLLEIPNNITNPFEGVELFQTTFNATTIQDQTWRMFAFPPIFDSVGKTYVIILQSPNGEPGNAITVGGIEQNVYPKGTAFLGVIPVQADITFRTCYAFSSGEKLSILTQQLIENKPSVWGDIRFYIVLLTLYVLILLGVFIGLIRLVQQKQ